MAKQVFRLRGVPDDEAGEVRELLTANDVDFYETPAGNWGISMPALWVRDDRDYARAKALLDDYQAKRLQQARRDRAARRAAGTEPSLLDSLRANPLRFAVYVGFALFILYVSTKPFLALDGP